MSSFIYIYIYIYISFCFEFSFGALSLTIKVYQVDPLRPCLNLMSACLSSSMHMTLELCKFKVKPIVVAVHRRSPNRSENSA
jgi:hypothetical protein